MKELDRNTVIRDVEALSKVYNTKTLTVGFLYDLLKNPLVKIICRYADLEKQEGLRAYCILYPNLNDRLTCPGPGQNVRYTVNLEYWGRDVFVTDEEMVTLFTQCLIDYMVQFTSGLLDGTIKITKPGEIVLPKIPVARDDLNTYGFWKLKTNPESYELLQLIHECPSFLVKESRKLHNHTYIIYGCLCVDYILEELTLNPNSLI